MKASILNRKLHRWGPILTAVPLLCMLLYVDITLHERGITSSGLLSFLPSAV